MLPSTRAALKGQLVGSASLREIRGLFEAAGFDPLSRTAVRKSDAIEYYFSQIDWDSALDSERLFPVVLSVLRRLSLDNRRDLANGGPYRGAFRALCQALGRDGAMFFGDAIAWGRGVAIPSVPATRGAQSVSIGPRQQIGDVAAVDLLCIAALTEEAQVVNVVLSRLATRMRVDGSVAFYEFDRPSAPVFRVAFSSPHEMGAVALRGFAQTRFGELRPRRAALVGIAASLAPEEVGIGDVPVATDVFSADDIAVEGGELSFRSKGYPTDRRMMRSVGGLMESHRRLAAWQRACVEGAPFLASELDQLRGRRVVAPAAPAVPYIHQGIICGGPFLLRDEEFRNALRGSVPVGGRVEGVRVRYPLHPKLIALEMESHGFMTASLEEGVPACVFKGISDVGDPDKARLERESGGFFRAYACQNALLALLHALDLGEHER